eukprot:gene26200-34821_t
MIFGSAAMSWLVVLFFHAFSSGSFAEAYMLFATTLWLTANFIWMHEEVTYQTDDIVTPKTEKMMLAAIVYILVYYLVLRPLNILTFEQSGAGPVYEDAELVPRFSFYFRPLLYAFIVVDLARVRAHTHVVLAFERFELDGWQLIHLGDIAHLRRYSLVDSTRWWSSWIFLLALLILLAVWASLTGQLPPPTARYHIISSSNDDDGDNAVGEEESNTVQPPYHKDSLPYGTFR